MRRLLTSAQSPGGRKSYPPCRLQEVLSSLLAGRQLSITRLRRGKASAQGAQIHLVRKVHCKILSCNVLLGPAATCLISPCGLVNGARAQISQRCMTHGGYPSGKVCITPVLCKSFLTHRRRRARLPLMVSDAETVQHFHGLGRLRLLLSLLLLPL